MTRREFWMRRSLMILLVVLFLLGQGALVYVLWDFATRRVLLFVPGVAMAQTDPGAAVVVTGGMTGTQTFTLALVTALVAAIPGLIAALAAARTMMEKLAKVEHHMNSRLDELVAATKREAFAAGGAAERERATGVEKPATA